MSTTGTGNPLLVASTRKLTDPVSLVIEDGERTLLSKNREIRMGLLVDYVMAHLPLAVPLPYRKYMRMGIERAAATYLKSPDALGLDRYKATGRGTSRLWVPMKAITFDEFKSHVRLLRRNSDAATAKAKVAEKKLATYERILTQHGLPTTATIEQIETAGKGVRFVAAP